MADNPTSGGGGGTSAGTIAWGIILAFLGIGALLLAYVGAQAVHTGKVSWPPFHGTMFAPGVSEGPIGYSDSGLRQWREAPSYAHDCEVSVGGKLRPARCWD